MCPRQFPPWVWRAFPLGAEAKNRRFPVRVILPGRPDLRADGLPWRPDRALSAMPPRLGPFCSDQETILRWCRRRRPFAITSCAYLHNALGSRSARSQTRARSGFERQKNSRALSGSVDPQVASRSNWSMTARHRATSPLEPTNCTDSMDTQRGYHGFKFVGKSARPLSVAASESRLRSNRPQEATDARLRVPRCPRAPSDSTSPLRKACTP